MAEPSCETCWSMTQFYRDPARAPLCPWCQDARDDGVLTPELRRRAACRRGATKRSPGPASRASNATFFEGRTGT